MFNRKEHDGELLENFLNKNIDFSRNLYAHSKHNVKVIYTLLNFYCLFWFSHNLEQCDEHLLVLSHSVIIDSLWYKLSIDDRKVSKPDDSS